MSYEVRANFGLQFEIYSFLLELVSSSSDRREVCGTEGKDLWWLMVVKRVENGGDQNTLPKREEVVINSIEKRIASK